MLFIQSYTSLICYPLRFFFLNLPTKYYSINFLTIVISKFLAACAISTFVYTININFAIILLRVFLSASLIHKGYLCLDQVSGHIYITRHVLFHETKFPFWSSSSASVFLSFIQQLTLTLALLPILPSVSLSKTSIPTPKFFHHVLPLIIPYLLPPYLTSSRFLLLHPFPIILISIHLLPKIKHHRITQAKASISKKKLLLVQKATKPHSYQQAFKDPNCVTTMEKEYQTLISNTLGN